MPVRPHRKIAALALVAAAGCYRHVPVAPLAPGAPVRLYLTSNGTEQLAPRLGPATIVVEGRVDSVGPTAVALVVTRTTKSYGGAVAWVGERVTIPTALVAHAERRVLDRRRTTSIAATTVLAAGAALVALIRQGGGGSPDPGPSGGGPAP